MKKLIALLLVILTLLTLLASCKQGGGNEGEAGTLPANADPTRTPPEVKNFGGYEFKFFLDTQCKYELQVPESMEGDGINKALIERNKLIESAYNITISERRNVNTADGAYTFLQSAATSGDYFADIYSMYAVKMINTHAINGFYQNVMDIQSLRLSEEWWDQDFISEMAINNRLYTLTGDIQINDDIHETMTAMNLKLYNDTFLGTKNFYQIVVEDGAWTWDEFYTTWNSFSSKDGGTTGVVDSSDMVGYYYDCRTVNYMYMAAGLKAFKMVNNKPEISITSEKALEVIDRLEAITNANSGLKTVQAENETVQSGGWEGAARHFAAGKALFLSCNFGDALQYYGEMDSVIYPPFPKYDAAQDRYYSLVHMVFEPMAISANVTDKERTGLILEALATYSATLEEEVMKVLLRERLSSDREAREILQLTLDSKVYDFEYTAGVMAKDATKSWTNMANKLFTEGKLDEYPSTMKALSRTAVNNGRGELEVFLKKYSGLDFRK